MKICFFRLSAIGDCVLATPAVNAILKRYPNCEFTWVTTKPIASLLSEMPKVNFLVIDKPKTIRDYLRLRNKFKDLHFDVLLAAQASLRANLLYPFIKAKRKIGFDSTRANDFHSLFIKEAITYDDEHLVEGFMKFAVKLGAASKNFVWYVNTSQMSSNKSAFLPRIVINIAASKEERSWPAYKYADLIKTIELHFLAEIVLIGGNTDFEKSQEAAIKSKISGSKYLNLVGQTTLGELVDILNTADVLISPDSGPVHIANALGKPVVGLFAVARPELTGPYGNMQYSIDKYPDAVRRYLGKVLNKHSGMKGSTINEQ